MLLTHAYVLWAANVLLAVFGKKEKDLKTQKVNLIETLLDLTIR